jgi:hypothetical protein
MTTTARRATGSPRFTSPACSSIPAIWRGPRFRELPNRHGEYRIKIGRREWACRHLLSCVGNIYWERYGFEPWTAAALLHWLRASKWFQPDSGFEELWKWWDSGIAADALVRSLLIDAAKDDRL